MTYSKAPDAIADDPIGNDDSFSSLSKPIQDILYAKDARTCTSRPLAGKLTDLTRLLSMEEQLDVEAHTVSLCEYDVNEQRHVNVSLSNKKFVEKVREKWEGISFDQISLDWINIPNSYIGAKNIELFALLKDIAENQLLNAGGAIYLPFKLQYYAVIAYYEMALVDGYYNIDFIDEDIVSKENHLYCGTVALGDAVLDKLSIEHIASDCVTMKQIGESGDVQGIPMDEVKKH